MGRTHTKLERHAGMSADSIARPDGMASPFAGTSLSPVGRETVLGALRDAWTRNPTLRLCQLLVNATGRDEPIHVEDGELLALLREYRRTT